MSAADIMRFAIIISALVVAYLWILVGKKTHHWSSCIIVLIWLAFVILFFIVRFVFKIDPMILNIISLSLYLMAITSLGGIALAKLRANKQQERGDE